MADKSKALMKILQAKLDQYVNRIDLLYELTTKVGSAKEKRTFLARYAGLGNTRELISNTLEEIQMLKVEADEKYVPDFSLLLTVDEKLGNIEYTRSALAKSDIEGESSLSEPKPKSLKLPKLNLPSFSGDIKEWPIFFETFKTLIHDNQGLSNAEKVQYLLGRLSGRALPIISGIPPTERNYQIIWNALVEKFEDKRRLATSYVSQLFNFKPLSGESSSQLEVFLDQFVSAFDALKSLNLDNLVDFIIFHLAATKLDKATIRNFEMSDRIREKEFPEFSDLVQFVKQQTRILEQVPGNSVVPYSKIKNTHFSKSPRPHSFHVAEEPKTCNLCSKGSHPLYYCTQFLDLTPEARHSFVKQEGRCFNCLSTVHRSPYCKSPIKCKTCSQNHHSLLHLAGKKEDAVSGVTLCSVVNQKGTSILLGTAIISVIDSLGKKHPIRVLVDSASQPNLITSRCCKALNLRYSPIASYVKGMGGSPTKIFGRISLTFSSRFDDDMRYTSDFLVVNSVSGDLPSAKVDVASLPFLEGIRLADPNFDSPGPIDAILGAEYFAMIMRSGQINHSSLSCIALGTSLGYIVLGKVPTLTLQRDQTTLCCFQSDSLNALVQKFWTLEDIPIESAMSEDDRQCEEIFKDTHSRDSNGRYLVVLPFKIEPSMLGESFNTAFHRFRLLEKRFQNNPHFYKQYCQEIKKLLDRNYLVPSGGKDGYFIPHHAVFRPESTSTPLRIVFDASSKTTSGLSLNELLYSGAKLQTDTAAILLRFRLFPIGLTADIQQMFLRILVQPQHRKFQKIIWRFDIREPLKVYELTRVVFGMTSSPFLAQRTIQQLAQDERSRFPHSAPYIPEDMYVDDLVVSVPNLEKGMKVFTDSVNIFRAGGFELLKWASNNAEMLQAIPVEIRRPASVSLDTTHSKVLGLNWDPQADQFFFQCQGSSEGMTKRKILSTLARIFDPLGFLGPVLLSIKLLLRELWIEKTDWDCPLPSSIVQKWLEVVRQLPLLSNLKIPRHVSIQENAVVWLVGFCDGSQVGYGAAVYVRSSSFSGECFSHLFCSKSRVAPLNNLFTIPRSELCSALLLSLLIRFVVNSIESRIKIEKIFALTDSLITYHRIQSLGSKVDVFVRNRINKIRETLPQDVWRHIPTSENAADSLSRGLLPQQLLNSENWLTGPRWLVKDPSLWPTTRPFSPTKNVTEENCFVVVQEEETEDSVLLNLTKRVSEWNKLLSSVVYILRFGKILKSIKGPISAEELESAELYLLRAIQQKYFHKEFALLKSNQPCRKEIQKLQPFVANGLLRVGGRLKNSDLEFNQKHPILLPKEGAAVSLLVRFFHRKFLHAGPQLLMSLIRQKYWILGVRALVRKTFQTCNICFRVSPKPFYPLMGDLPASRVQPSFPFWHTGVDYAGPFLVTTKRARGQRPHKAYLCVFVCLCIKAIHLEVAENLSTQAFLNAFKRFIARRGRCDVLYSDNGTNFVGANNALKEVYKLLDSDEFKSAWQGEFAGQRISWKFNPPSAPHFGGLWEASVKGVKTHLSRVVGSQILSLDEFLTIIAQIEALLNSRPLGALSEDPSEFRCLTPAHFLIGRPLTALPCFPVTQIPENRLTRPQLLDSIIQRFWKRWRLEYLHTLQNRKKWDKSTPAIVPGTIVLCIEPNVPPLSWPLGKVEMVYPGKDGISRVAVVNTKAGMKTRPVVKLCPLPTQ